MTLVKPWWIAAVAALVAATMAIFIAPYARNYMAFSISDPDRVLDTVKYSPLEPVQGAGVPVALPELHGLLDEAAVQALDEFATDTDSFALVVGVGDSIVYSHFADGLDAETLVDSFSIHKGLLSIAFGYALESGAIESLDERAGRYLEEWQQDARRSITVHDLLANQSGLAQESFNRKPYNPVLDLFIGRNLHALTLQRTVDHTPGSAFDFNHINAQALYFVLTRATNKRYAELVSEYLWMPLGNETGFVALDRARGDARAICCFIGSVSSWLRFGLMLANNGVWDGRQVVAPEWLQTVRTPVSHNPSAGFSVWLVEPFTGKRIQSTRTGSARPLSGPFLAEDTYFMEASGNGRIYVVPSRRLAIFRVGRLTNPWASFDDAFVVNTVVAGLDTTTQNPTEGAE